MQTDIKTVADPSLQPVAAALSVVLGMFVLGLSDNLLPHVSGHASLSQFHLLRSAVALGLLALAAWLVAARFWPRRFWPVLARNMFTSLAMVLYFGALAVMPASVVAAGFFTAPLWTLVLSVVFLRVKVGPVRWAAVVLGAVGVLMAVVLRTDLAGHGAALIVPVAAGFFYALGAITTRAWCAQESTMAMSAMFFGLLGLFGAIGVLVLPIAAMPPAAGVDGFALRGWVPLGLADIGWIAAQGLAAVVGIALIFRGYLIGEASYVAIFEYTLLLFVSFWAWQFWGQEVPPMAMAGMALIALAGGIIALRSRA